MFQNNQKVVVVSGGDERRVIKVQSASGTPDPSRYPIVDTTGVLGRDQQVQIVSGGDATRFPILRGVSDARATADSVITALTPAAWYRNATGVTEAGGFASQWDDYSGNGRHLIQGTGTNQPAYAAGVFTGDGADNYMTATSWTETQPTHIIGVFRQDSWTSNDRIMDGTALSSAEMRQRTATPNLSLYSNGAAFIDSVPDPAIGDWFISAALFNGTSSHFKINGNAATGSGVDVGVAGMGGVRLFCAGGVAGNYGHASCQELIVFSSALSDTDRDAVMSALNDIFSVY